MMVHIDLVHPPRLGRSFQLAVQMIEELLTGVMIVWPRSHHMLILPVDLVVMATGKNPKLLHLQ